MGRIVVGHWSFGSARDQNTPRTDMWGPKKTKYLEGTTIIKIIIIREIREMIVLGGWRGGGEREASIVWIVREFNQSTLHHCMLL